MSASQLDVAPSKVAALFGEQVEKMLEKLKSDILARCQTSSVFEAPVGFSGIQRAVSGERDEVSTVLPEAALQASELYPGFKLIAKSWNYDALILLDRVQERCDLPGILDSSVEVLVLDGLRDLLDLLARTPRVITNSVLAGSVSMGFGNHVSFGWFDGSDEARIVEFVFGPGSESNCDMIDISIPLAEASSVPIPPVNEVTIAVLNQSHPVDTTKDHRIQVTDQQRGWQELLRRASASQDGLKQLAEERLRRFRLLDNDPFLPLVDQVLGDGQESLIKVSEVLSGGKSFELESVTNVSAQILVSLVLRWDEPLDPPVRVQISLEGDKHQSIPLFGRKPFQTIFDFDIIMQGNQETNLMGLECTALTENGSVYSLALDQRIRKG